MSFQKSLKKSSCSCFFFKFLNLSLINHGKIDDHFTNFLIWEQNFWPRMTRFRDIQPHIKNGHRQLKISLPNKNMVANNYFCPHEIDNFCPQINTVNSHEVCCLPGESIYRIKNNNVCFAQSRGFKLIRDANFWYCYHLP